MYGACRSPAHPMLFASLGQGVAVPCGWPWCHCRCIVILNVHRMVVGLGCSKINWGGGMEPPCRRGGAQKRGTIDRPLFYPRWGRCLHSPRPWWAGFGGRIGMQGRDVHHSLNQLYPQEPPLIGQRAPPKKHLRHHPFHEKCACASFLLLFLFLDP